MDSNAAVVERLRGRRALSALFEKGAAGRSRNLLVRLLPSEGAHAPRAAVIVPKRFGGAVARNRMRRRLRAALREVASGAPRADFAVLAGRNAAELAWEDLKKELRSALRAAGKASAP
ncbi:MAG: ribonuclease P protein component [Planctomycetota bacterium]